MSDQVVRVLPEVTAAPADFPIPNAAEWALQVITATFDGTGAGGAFLPAVQIISPGGVIVATFADKNNPVSAGGSAEATFGPFLTGISGGGGGGGLTGQFARYTATPLTLLANATGRLPLSGPAFGPALLDISTPATPTVIASGIYAFSCVFRVNIPFGGTPTAGSAWSGSVDADSGNATAKCFQTIPTAAGTWLPQMSSTTTPWECAAGSAVTFSITNSDGASTRVYDSPAIDVVLLS